MQTHVRSERYYYDGARRIQEVVADLSPVSGGSGGGSGGSGGTFQDIGIAAEIGSVAGDWSTGLAIQSLRVDREYVYVPSAAGGYVDEFIEQFDRYGDPWWILQDANYNVLAMTDADGDVARQVMYDPYGEPLFAEDFGAHPGLKIGHQGLFFDRLELPAAVSGSVSLGGATQLEPGVFGLYQARNRLLLPRYGRWAQKDPNASGMLHASLWHDGQAPIPELAAGSLQGVTRDGPNIFAFVRSSPFNASDAMGLFIGMLGAMAPMQSYDIYSDYNEEALDASASAADTISSIFDSYAWDKLSQIEEILEGDTREYIYASDSQDTSHTDARCGNIDKYAVARPHVHHVIPRFLQGLSNAHSYLDLPPKQHKLFHRLLDTELQELGLSPSNARGDDNWRKRFREGDVTPHEQRKVKLALERACRKFDKDTHGRYGASKKLRKAFDSNMHTMKALLKAKNGRSKR